MNLVAVIKSVADALKTVAEKGASVLPPGLKTSEGQMLALDVTAAILRAPTIFDRIAAAPDERLWAAVAAGAVEAFLYGLLAVAIAFGYSLNRTRFKLGQMQHSADVEEAEEKVRAEQAEAAEGEASPVMIGSEPHASGSIGFKRGA